MRIYTGMSARSDHGERQMHRACNLPTGRGAWSERQLRATGASENANTDNRIAMSKWRGAKRRWRLREAVAADRALPARRGTYGSRLRERTDAVEPERTDALKGVDTAEAGNGAKASADAKAQYREAAAAGAEVALGARK